MPQRFSSDVELQLLRIAQEAIRNAVRHGKATHIRVELGYGRHTFKMRVSDNGRGFTIAEDTSVGSQNWGLVGMRERAKRLGGSFQLTSRLEQGTEVETTI